MRATFNVMFFVQKGKCKADGTAPILARLTVNQEKIHFSTTKSILPERWDTANHRTFGRTQEEKSINQSLDELKASVHRHFFDLQSAGETISAHKIKSLLFSTDEKKNISVEKLFDLFISDYEKLVLTQDYGKESFFRYKVCKDRVMHFIEKEYKTSDLPLTDINKRFLDKLYLYLRTERKLNNNTAVKFLHRFSSVFKMARDNGWVSGDPFKLQNLHLDKVDRGYLTQAELDAVMSKEFDTKRLEQVRDVFVFCCFTGLPYIDAKSLNENQLKRWSDGNLWLSLKRQKTKVPVNVKLLPVALQILDKYSDGVKDRKGRLLPVPSNQKCNEYLKEMATLCGIHKEVTFHVARHTFATTVTLENGVPIESVSKMLGHTNVKTTQIYARITDTKVNNDMEVLKAKIDGVFHTSLPVSKEAKRRADDRLEIADMAKEMGVALV